MSSATDANSEHPRRLTTAERRVIDLMLEKPFEGRDELHEQLKDARVIADGPADTRTIVFAEALGQRDRARTAQRVPVDLSMSDIDGTSIDVLLHVVNGYAQELEAYRVDGEPVERSDLDGPVQIVNRYPLRDD